MEILVFIVVTLVGILVESTVGVKINAPGIGYFVSLAFLGSIVLWNIRHKK